MTEVKWHPIIDEGDFPPKLHTAYLITFENDFGERHCGVDSLTYDADCLRWDESADDVVAWAELPEGRHYGDNFEDIEPYRDPPRKMVDMGAKIIRSELYRLDVSFHWHLCDRHFPRSLPTKDGDYFVAYGASDGSRNLIIDIMPFIAKNIPYEWATGDVVAWAEIPEISHLTQLIEERAKEAK